MTPKDKEMIAICNVFWKKRIKDGIWEDAESETVSTPENLVYKRLDGLRSIIRPISAQLKVPILITIHNGTGGDPVFNLA
ncbi:MAG: hypothetical protein ACUZ8I_13785 [Candidatus Scalindua sp.]